MVQSVARAIDILEALGQAGEGIRLSDIAEMTGLRNNTAHNLLKTLVARGYAEKSGRGPVYGLGEEALKLAYAGENNSVVREAAAFTRSLCSDCAEATWVFSQQIGGSVVVRLRMSPDKPRLLQKPHGVLFPPYATASGLTFLAFSPEEDAMKIRQQSPFYEQAVNLWGTPGKLDKFLVDARKKGFVIPPFTDQGMFKAAVPVFDRGGLARFALGASLPAGHAFNNKDRVVAAMRGAADNLSGSLKSNSFQQRM